MAMRVVFPADDFHVRQPDGAFADQAAAFAAHGWGVSTFTFDGDRVFRPALVSGETVLYRGWMLDGAGYRAFVGAVEAGARVLTSPDTDSVCFVNRSELHGSVNSTSGTRFSPARSARVERFCKPFNRSPHEAYLAAHHLPRWAPLLADVSPETVCFTNLHDLAPQLERLGWDGFFVKDFVKSLKTGAGGCITRPDQIGELLASMAHFRGQIAGGVCVRRVEDLDPASEVRFFVRAGRAFSADGSDVPDMVRDVAGRIASPFFSVDVARRADGVLRVVEVGDGQVSDLVGWTPAQFMAVWADAEV